MSCPGRELMLDRQHVASCKECQARALLQTFEPEPMSRIERSRLWAKIESERAPRSRFGIVFAAACAAAACVALLYLRTADPPDSSRPQLAVQEWLDVGAGVALPFPDIRLETSAKLWLEPGREMRVFRGVLAVAATEPMLIETPMAKISANAHASYRLEVEPKRTRIAVERGQVELVAENGEKRLVRAGESAELPPRLATLPSPPVVEPIAKIEPEKKETKTIVRASKPKEIAPLPAPVVEEEAQLEEPSPVRREIEKARELVKTDAEQAREIVDRVLAEKPRGTDEVEALIISADARRRSGRLAEAEQRYAQVIDHPAGTSFAEEAMLRRATILSELSRAGDALRVLELARERFEHGALVPERIALEARLLHERGETHAAALLLESAGKDRVLDPVRLEVGRALLESDPARANRLFEMMNRKPSGNR